jgi:hypothetical protein
MMNFPDKSVSIRGQVSPISPFFAVEMDPLKAVSGLIVAPKSIWAFFDRIFRNCRQTG